jgi:hypothetical protein
MALEWVYYSVICCHTLGMTSFQFWVGGGYLGQIGALLPQKHLSERPLKVGMVYFD